MPVRSLNSSVLKWPDRDQVDHAVREWAARVEPNRRGVVALRYFGSYARGDWGVGSDLDLIMILDHTDQCFERRALSWDLTELPVPASLLVYTLPEWERLRQEGGRFVRTVERETLWVFKKIDRR
jgi:predicted nucleotidyltransferase